MDPTPRFTHTTTDDLQDWVAAQFTAMTSPPDATMLQEALATLPAATANLLGDTPGVIANFPDSPFAHLEAQTSFHFALDPKAYQVICSTADTGAAGLDWPRFGISLAANDSVVPFFSPSMYDHGIDLAAKTPDVAGFLNDHREMPVVAFLGTARVDADKGAELIAPIRDVVTALPGAAFMTGGYRGAFEHNYGVTRAGFDVPKAMGRPTLWVMCAAGAKDASQSPDAKSFCGRNWGDDTPGMEGCSDAAIFFRNIPSGKRYGAWTDVEIANFVASPKDKPIAIVDPEATADTERLFGRDVPLFTTGAAAAAYLAPRLPAVLAQRAAFSIGQMTMHTIQRGRPQDDIQMVDIRDATGKFHALYVPLAPRPETAADWEAADLPVPQGFPEGWNFMQACWQDLLALAQAGLLDLTRASSRDAVLALPRPEVIASYAKLRARVAEARAGAAPLFPAPTRHVNDASGRAVWFLYDDGQSPAIDWLAAQGPA